MTTASTEHGVVMYERGDLKPANESKGVRVGDGTRDKWGRVSKLVTFTGARLRAL